MYVQTAKLTNCKNLAQQIMQQLLAIAQTEHSFSIYEGLEGSINHVQPLHQSVICGWKQSGHVL